MWLWSSTWASSSWTQLSRSTPVRPMPSMAMAVIAGHLPVPGCAGPPSIRGLPVGVAVRGALENLRARADLGLRRRQDGALAGPGQGGNAWPRPPVVRILGRHHQALPFGERPGERTVSGGQVGVPGGGAELAQLITHVPGRPGGLDRVGVAQVQQPAVGQAADVRAVGRAEGGQGLKPYGPNVWRARGRFRPARLGGGGSVLAVPVLAYGLGPSAAQAPSGMDNPRLRWLPGPLRGEVVRVRLLARLRRVRGSRAAGAA